MRAHAVIEPGDGFAGGRRAVGVWGPCRGPQHDRFDRAQAWSLLTEFTKGESLRKHARAVEASMRAYAARYDADADRWGVAGMLHDFDYEMHPRAPHHPMKGAEILRARGVPDDVVYAILAHADYSGMPRTSLLDRALYACDELTGFVHACALVRPGKVVTGLDPSSVRKKLKDKAFARTVNRDDVYRGATELGVDLDAHIAFVVSALTDVAPDVGLSR
ncbi:MAG: HDIG domain-containing protein [Candidatus Rokubacteria bacterium]|nr:HDIG domain-containing protein [Candidatus Rokubacteria bacterium]